MSGGAQGLVAADSGRAVLFPRSAVLADWDDRSGLAVDVGGVAAAGVIGAIGGHGADLFAIRDLVKQVRQDRTVAIAAGGELHRPEVRSGRTHSQMHLAPLAAALNTVFARLPFAIAEELDALAGSLEPVALTGSLSTSRLRGPSTRRQGIWTATVFCRRHKVV